MISKQEVEELYRIVVGLRGSLDSSLRISRSREDPIFLEKFKEISLRVEAIRLDLNLARRIGAYASEIALRKVRDDLLTLLDDKNFHHVTRDTPFRASPVGRKNLIPSLLQPNIPFPVAIEITVSRIEQILALDSDVESIRASAALRQIVPPQKLAPAMFDIVDGKIVVIRQPLQVDAKDKLNVVQARDALVERGKGIIEALELSNCDRRVLDSIRELQVELERQDNIIELGLLNMTVERVCKGVAAELPDALLGAIEGQTAGIGMYVAQFPAWQRFSENAANIELETADVESIEQAAQAVIDRLTARPDIAEADVPRTLKALKLLISDPQVATKRAAFAVLRTVENLVAKIYQYGAEFLDQTAYKTVDGLSKATSTVIISSLLAIALVATTNLGGVTAKIAETTWMRTAAEIVKKQIEENAN